MTASGAAQWRLRADFIPVRRDRAERISVRIIGYCFLALGAYVAYWTLDKAIEFLIAWAGPDVKANFQISKYISLVGLMVAAFGIAFEFPVLLVFLQLVGVVTPQTLKKGWRYAIMIIFVIAAVITPSGDPYSMLALAIPMSVFYLISIVIGLIFQKRKRAAEAAAD